MHVTLHGGMYKREINNDNERLVRSMGWGGGFGEDGTLLFSSLQLCPYGVYQQDKKEKEKKINASKEANVTYRL